MDSQEYQKKLGDVFADVFETLGKKNQDYAGEDGFFADFERSADVAGVSVEQGIIVRIMSKVNRITNLLNRPGAVIDEKVGDTAMDLVGYSAILALWLRENRVEEQKNPPKTLEDKIDNYVTDWFKSLFLPTSLTR